MVEGPIELRVHGVSGTPWFWHQPGRRVALAARGRMRASVSRPLVLCARRLSQRQCSEVAELYGVGDDPRGPHWPRVVQIGRAMASDAAERYAAQSTPPPWPWSSSGPSSICSTTVCPWRTGFRR
jgi:hypothetical protein